MYRTVLRDPRLWIRPLALVTVSMGLHGVLLWLPLAESSVPEAKETPPEDRIRITALPLAEAPITEAPARELPKLPPEGPRPQPTPRVTERPPAPQPRPQPMARPQQERPAPQPTPEPTPPNPQPTPSESTPPNPQPTPPAGDRPSESTNPPANPQPPAPNPTGDPFANFPAYPNAQRGSESLLNPSLQDAAQNTPDALATVANFYQVQGTERGFTLTVANQGEGLKVYAVAIANVTPRYLHLLTLEQKTVMMLLSEPLDQTTLARLQEVETLTAEEREFEQFFAQLYRDRAMADFELDGTVLANLPSTLANEPDRLQTRGKIAQPLNTAKSEVLERMRQNNRYFAPMEIVPGMGIYSVNSALPLVHFVALDGGQATGVITTRP